MTLGLKIHWGLWTLLVTLVATGVIVDHLSSAKTIPLELRPKASVDVSIFRPLPDALNLVLYFNRIDGQKRPELGEFTMTGEAWQKTGILQFPKPGASIKLLVRGESREVVYEALPAGSYGAKVIGRDLVPFIDDGDPNRFTWPPNLAQRQILPSGHSPFNISVLDVGPQLVGEQVSLIIEAPVTFKSTAPGYGFLWWFIFWPLYAFLLLVYGAALLWRSVRHYGPNTSFQGTRRDEAASRP